MRFETGMPNQNGGPLAARGAMDTFSLVTK
jgi:hypothetical protein